MRSAGEILFIADVHLDPARPAIVDLFLGFLSRDAVRAQALYILGDLFEAWIGDDDPCPHYQPVLEGLKMLTTRGTPAYVLHGNRDFLMGRGFEARTGCRLLPDPSVIALHGVPTLIMHGDTLCTGDAAYQRYRTRVRDPAWQRRFLSKPLEERRTVAAELREKSRRETAGKPDAIMDVDQIEVERVMREHGVRRIIHGHTHRPGVHRFPLDGGPAERIVLGDWYHQGSVLRVGPAGCRLTRHPEDQVPPARSLTENRS